MSHREWLNHRSSHHHDHQYQKRRGYYATSDYRCDHKHKGGLGILKDPFAWISVVSAGSFCKHSGKWIFLFTSKQRFLWGGQLCAVFTSPVWNLGQWDARQRDNLANMWKKKKGIFYIYRSFKVCKILYYSIIDLPLIQNCIFYLHEILTRLLCGRGV